MSRAVCIMGLVVAWAPLPSLEYALGSTAEGKPSYIQERFSYSQIHMGVSVNITLYAPSQSQAEQAAKAAFDRFAELDGIMSDYRRDSELNRLVAKAGEGPQPVSKDLFRVLSRAQEVSRLSNGAFDITAGPLVRRWREVRRTAELPYRSEVLEIRKKVGWWNLILDPKAQTADLRLPNMTLDLGGIAKGYACDEATRVLKAHGIESSLVEAGGDIVVSAAPPGRPSWVIEVRGWKEPLFVSNAAISTSGDSEQFVDIGGRRFSHIVDPRTGYGLTDSFQVTVIARDGLTTDPLATAISVMGMQKGFPLAERYRARLVFVGG